MIPAGLSCRSYPTASRGLTLPLLLLIDAVVLSVSLQLPRPACGQAPNGPAPVTAEASQGTVEWVRDQDLERVLAELDRQVAAGEWSLAVPLAERLVREGEAVVDVSGTRRRQALSVEAERRLARFPPPALAAYRLRVDGTARAILAEAENVDAVEERRRLAEVSRRYLFSSHGDAATWRWGARALDGHDFVTASRCFERLATLHPAPSHGRGAAWLRKALADVGLGDFVGAQKALQQAERLQWPPAEDEREAPIHAYVTSRIAAHATAGDAERAAAAGLDAPWRAPSSPAEVSLAKSLGQRPTSYWRVTPCTPSSMLHETGSGQRLSAADMHQAVLQLSQLDPFGPGYDDVIPRDDAAAAGRRWLRTGWGTRPALTVAGDRVWQTVGRRLVAWTPAAAGWQVAWMGDEDEAPAVPAAWGMFPPPARGLRDPPRSLLAVDLDYWCDGMRHAVTSAGEWLLRVEPMPAESVDAVPQVRRRWSWRTRSNQLVAYDAATGEVRWRRKAGELVAGVSEATFLGPPAAGHDRCFVPLLAGTTVRLAALDLQQGDVRWVSPLSGEPRAGAWPWSAAAVTVAGQDVYLVAGSGLVGAFDEAQGALQWLAAYERGGQLATAASVIPRGWDEERLLVVGGRLFVVASDCEELRAYDRRTGELLWATPQQPPRERAGLLLVGASRDQIIVAGRDGLRGYEMATGRLIWQAEPGTLAGAAAIVDQLLVVPCLTARQSTARAVLGVNDPWGGEAPVVELVLLDAATGQERQRAPLDAAPPLPVGVVPLPAGLTLASPAGWFSLQAVDKREERPAATGWTPLRFVEAAAEARPAGNAPAGTSPTGTSPPAGQPAANRPAAPRILVSDLANGRISELNEMGQTVWTHEGIRLPGPCCGWPDGRRWVLDHERNELVEWDARGQLQGRWTGLPGRPAHLRALADGTAVMAFPELGVCLQVGPRGEWRRRVAVPGRPVDIVADGSRSWWVALGGERRVIGIDDAGRVDVSLEIDGQLMALAEVAPNRVWVTASDTGLVTEIERRGGSPSDGATAVRQSPVHSGARGLRRALPLPGGRWLAAGPSALQLYSEEGPVVWQREGMLVSGLAVIPASP
ncbi:MAG: PQQ-binding-like beta-propeller repeat protein [Pirellulales bacterium]